MGAVWIVARRDLRRRWVTLVLIGVMGGLAVGAAAGALTAARRTATAYERLEDATRLEDALLLVHAGDPAVDAVMDVDGIEHAVHTGLWIGALQDDAVNFIGITAADWSAPLYRPALVEGRLPSPDDPDEVLLNEQLRFGDLGVGDRVGLSLLSPFQYGEFPQTQPPQGPDVTAEIVGTYRLPGLPGIVPPLVAGPAWAQEYTEWKASDVVVVDLEDPTATGAFVLDLQEVERTVPRIANRQEFPVVEPLLLAPQRESVAAATAILVGGLMAFVVVTLVAGGVAVTQALVRMHGLGANDQAAEAALGMTPTQRLIARGIGLVPPIVIAASLTVIGGIIGGGFEPIGSARIYEPAPGARPNLAAIGAALLLVVVGIGGIGFLSAWRAGRVGRRTAPQRASAAVARLARVGAGAVGVTGVRFALEPGRGRSAVPTRTALVSTSVGIAGIVAVIVFGTGLHDLVNDPALWGENADLRISAEVSADEIEASGVEGISGSAATHVGQILAGDQLVPAEAVRPLSSPLAWTIIAGRVPERAGEVTLGTRVARHLDLGLGDTMVVTDRRGAEHRLAVVGTGLGATLSSSQLGGTALMWPDDLQELSLADTFGETYVDVADGADPEAVGRALGEVFEVSHRELPPEVANLDRLGRLPVILGAFLAVIALLGVGNALVLATRRRRRDLGVLRSMGFRPRDAGATILAMALTIVTCGLVVGVPIGAALGSVLWRGVAYSTAVPADLGYPIAVLAALIVGFVVAVLLLAVLPARRAASLRPADALRSE